MARYFEFNSAERKAIACVLGLAPIYDLEIDFNLFPDDSVYTRKIAAVLIGLLGSDLRDTALSSGPHSFGTGFDVLSHYIKKISTLL